MTHDYQLNEKSSARSQPGSYFVSMLDFSHEDDYAASEFSTPGEAKREAKRLSRAERDVAWAVWMNHGDLCWIFFAGKLYVEGK